jgi:hypothetical protein
MSFTVPPAQVAGFSALLSLPDDAVTDLLAALEAAGPQFNAEDLTNKVSTSSSVPKPILFEIALILVSLYRTVSKAKSTDELGPFLDTAVLPALKRAAVFSPDAQEAQWNKIRGFLHTALSMERTVGATAKAGPVLTEHERVFNDVRIMTDLRPIYHLNVSETPEAALIVHMMRITQRDQFSQKKSFYFALDSNDIAVMKRAIERAEQKEVALREIMKDSSVRILDVKPYY